MIKLDTRTKNGKRKRGHPVTRWTPTARAKLLENLQDYVEANDIPIVAEFAYQNHVDRTQLYQFAELSNAIKDLIAKKETALERLMLSGKQGVTTGCIFSLKQLGWKDRQEITGADGGPLTIIFAKELQGV